MPALAKSRKLHVLFLMGLLLILGSAAPTFAQDVIVEPMPIICCGVATNPDWLSIDYHRVNVTIDEQIANTLVEMQFTNHGEMLAEGTFMFPLPQGATVERLTMYVDGMAIDAKILPAAEARAIYDEIVRQYRDPALLEYVGQDLLQANVFPIAPGDSRKIDISYDQLLEIDNGLLHYVYPMHADGNASRYINQMNIRVDVHDDNAISNVYSPSHRIAISRPDDNSFTVGFEQSGFVPGEDFSLYYGLRQETIDINLLTYRESANEDGFFMLMMQPPLNADDSVIQPKDVVIVLDQSGSMGGTKWEQAREAAKYVLRNLNSQDRFNVISFSTGWRVYARELLPASESESAISWVNTLYAEGGTDINGALETALSFTQERPMTILFMTDGLATEGITETSAILANLEQEASPNARIFTFGVGDDVDTFLLDALVRDFRGTGSYVRPTERIDEEVASLYNKISAPVMNDIALQIDGITTELLYPQQLPDLFAGEQVTIIGRYRGDTNGATITLTGTVNGQQQTVQLANAAFPGRAGGDSFLGRLWATRRIGDLLNSIRLNGESDELVDSVVNLSIRYGIITPYTSFLIEEDDILSEQGRRQAMDSFEEEAGELARNSTGASAVDAADAALDLQSANAPASVVMSPTPAPTMSAAGTVGMGGAMTETAQEPGVLGYDADDGEGFFRPANPVQTIAGKTFLWQDGIWTDTTFNPDTMETVDITFLSDEYFDLLIQFPDAGQYLALGDQVIVVLDGTAYQIVPEATE